MFARWRKAVKLDFFEVRSTAWVEKTLCVAVPNRGQWKEEATPNRRAFHRSCVGVAVTFLCLMAGCGGDGLRRVPIQGTVKAQGIPLNGATVQLSPKEGTVGEGAIGMSDQQGKFTVISSRREDSGVPPGKYSVRISRLIDAKGNPLPADATQADHPDAKESIPAPYSLPSSPLEVTIDDKGGSVEIDVPAKVQGLKK